MIAHKAIFAKEHDPDLIGWWPAREGTGSTCADLSGNGRTATLTNSTWVKSGNVWTLRHDGTGDHLDCGDLAAWDFASGEAKSFMCWGYRVADVNGQDVIFGNSNWALGANGFTLAIRPTDLRLLGQFSGGWTISQTFSYTVSNSTWYHFAMTKDTSDDYRIYINGSQIGSTYNNTTSVGATQSLKFGGDADIYDFNGYTTDHRVYDRAVSGGDLLDIVALGRFA